MFDIPHLLKALRNMLIKYNYIVNGDIVSWPHIVNLYEREEYSVRRHQNLQTLIVILKK